MHMYRKKRQSIDTTYYKTTTPDIRLIMKKKKTAGEFLAAEF